MRAFTLLCLLLSAGCCVQAQNLLSNASFENVTDRLPAAWSAQAAWYEEPKGAGLSEAVADTAVVQGAGNASLRLTGAGNRGIVRQVLRYQPAWGRSFRLSGWIRTQDLGPACGRLTVEFLGEGDKWLGQGGVSTDWRVVSGEWQEFATNVSVPEAARYLVVSCNTDRANKGTAWFDNVALVAAKAGEGGNGGEPDRSVGRTKGGTNRPEPDKSVGRTDGEREPGRVGGLVPIDDFEGEGLAWGANAWGDAKPAQFAREEEAGGHYLRVNCPSAKANMVDRNWNYSGPWDALSLRLRRVSGEGGLSLYLVCGSVYFQAVYINPTADWQTVSVPLSKVGYSWGAVSEEAKQFDPALVTKLSFGHDGVIAFDLDDVAVDLHDEVLLRGAWTETTGNVFAPGDKPVLRAQMVNGFAEARTVRLEVEVRDYWGRASREAGPTREIALAGRRSQLESLALPALGRGYWVATVKLVDNGRIVGQQAVGLCALPPVERRGKAFMGASAFGLGADLAPLAAHLGVQAGEVCVRWSDYERRPGEISYEAFERTLSAFERSRIEPTGMLIVNSDSIPAWASGAPTPAEASRYLARDPAQFGRFVEALVRRFGKRVHRWCFCCEVDLAVQGWANGFDDYVAMVKAASAGARRADPKCELGGIGVSGVDCTVTPRFPVARRLWALLHDSLDGFMFDAYASPRYFGAGLPVLGPEANDEEGMYREALALVRQYGQDKRLGIEEKGWAIDTRLLVDDPLAGREAEYLARSFLLARSVDEVEHYMWFQFATRWDEGGYSYSLFRSEGDYLNPRPALAAYAGVAQFLCGVTRPQSLALHRDLKAVVFASGWGSRAALWTPLAEPVTLDVTLPAGVRLTDLLGNDTRAGSRGRLQVTSSPLYLWGDGVPAAKLAAALRQAKAHLPCARLAATSPEVTTLRVQVRNLLDRELRGKVTAEVPGGPAAGRTAPSPTRVPGVPLSAELTVAPQATAATSFRLDALPQQPFSVRFTAQGQGEVSTQVAPQVEHTPFLKTSPTIDGTLSECEGLPFLTLQGQPNLWPPDAPSAKMWTGVDDLSARVWTGWTPEGFYFAARVRDDRHVQQQSGTSIWQHDCIQLAFDPQRDALPASFSGRQGYDPDDTEFGLALTPQGAQTFQWVGVPSGTGRLVPEVRTVVRREGEYTLYESLLPWRLVGLEGAREGRVVGLNLALLDADRPEDSARYWLGFTPGICGGKDPSAFRGFVLEP